MGKHSNSTAQLGFDSLLADADEENDRKAFAKVTAHLPATWDEGLPFFHDLLQRHHAAMLRADENEVIRLQGEAEDLAAKLNGGTTFGMCAEYGSGTRLEAETAASEGVPLWGQAGNFLLDHEGMAVRIEMHGLFGICRRATYWPGFSAHVVNRRKPFLSETGYRSFIGCGLSALIPQMTPDQYISEILTDHITNQLGGKLFKVQPSRKAA